MSLSIIIIKNSKLYLLKINFWYNYLYIKNKCHYFRSSGLKLIYEPDFYA